MNKQTMQIGYCFKPVIQAAASRTCSIHTANVLVITRSAYTRIIRTHVVWFKT